METKEYSILPVVVIYKTSIYDTQTYEKLIKRSNVGQFMIYDNSPEDYKQADVPDNAIYVRDYANSGVSKAYNTACKFAIEHNYDRIMLLDQDTMFEYDLIEKASKCKSDICAPQILLKNGNPFSPCQWKHLRIEGIKLTPGLYSLDEYFFVNSGLCISIELFQKAGGYKESIKMDFADYEFAKRLQRQHKQFEVLDSIAIQDFSNEECNIEKLFIRFCIYIDGAKEYEPSSVFDGIKIKWLVLLHTLSLTKRTKKILFIKQFIKSFL